MNVGNAAAGTHYAGINVDGAVDESHYSLYNTVNPLAAGGQAAFSGSIDTAGLSVGQHTLTIKEDFWQNSVSESNEGNNVQTFTFNVTAPAKADLVVDSISAAASVMQGSNLDFSYVVKNLGSAPAGLHYTGFNVDGAVDESHYTAWGMVTSLDGNSQASFSNSVDTSHLSVGQHTLYIKEDFWQNSVSESNESNNVKTFTFEVHA
jgi:subtilase family serine protease